MKKKATKPEPAAKSSIGVKLVCVHVANDGAETYELMFVDSDTGAYSPSLEVRPGGEIALGLPDDDSRLNADVEKRKAKLRLIT